MFVLLETNTKDWYKVVEVSRDKDVDIYNVDSGDIERTVGYIPAGYAGDAIYDPSIDVSIDDIFDDIPTTTDEIAQFVYEHYNLAYENNVDFEGWQLFENDITDGADLERIWGWEDVEREYNRIIKEF